MRYRLFFGVMAWGAASFALAAPLTPAQQAFADAQALAQSAQANAVSNLSTGGVSSTVNQFNPTYYNSNGTAPESALFQNGNGNTVSAGQAKVSDCQNGAPNPDPFLRQNCEAINLMVKNPSNRPVFTIPPSLLAPSRAIVANANALAASSLGIADPNAVGGFSGCVNKTVGPPATTKICSEFKGTAAQQCTVGRVVVVDEFTDYKCDKTVDTYLPQTCDRTLQVTITQPTPIAATPVYATIPGLWNRGLCWVGSIDNGRSAPCYICNTDGSVFVYKRSKPPTLSAGPDGQILKGAYVCHNTTVVDHYTCPTNTTLTGTGTSSMCVQPPIVSSSVNNGCTVQEAAAL